jgi:hypothetical protein
MVLLFTATAAAQEQTPPPGDFIVGTPVGPSIVTNPGMFSSFAATGMNTIHQRADNDTKNLLTNYNLVAYNADTLEYIYHYSTAYYSKWEAEVDAEADRVGFKHRDRLGNLIGNSATWKDTSCWSSIGLSAPRDSLMYGPLYRQETRYKRWHYDKANHYNVMYTPRFNMALSNPHDVADSEDVCIIKVVYRYKVEYSPDSSDHIDAVFLQRTLKVEILI